MHRNARVGLLAAGWMAVLLWDGSRRASGRPVPAGMPSVLAALGTATMGHMMFAVQARATAIRNAREARSAVLVYDLAAVPCRHSRGVPESEEIRFP